MRTVPDKPRLTYANVMSTVALFIALGGASYAASGALAPGSVGTRQLRNGAVTPPKLAFGYASGGVGRSDRRISIGEEGCPKHAVKCGPPCCDKLVAETPIRLTRPARIMITATNVVENDSNSQSANVAIYNTIRGAPLEEPCFTQTIVPGGPVGAGTVSCAGATGTLRPGKYRLQIWESATGTRRVGIKAIADQVAVAWWTLPPGGRFR